ncbi:MAG: hypothetical protein J0H40_17890 [Rhizobiales bacterium]|nr:hypothetical protein [Hyphomicrobiales bacterium]
MSDDRFKEIFGKEAFPLECFETCGKPECVLDGCARLKREAESARAEQLLKEARAH